MDHGGRKITGRQHTRLSDLQRPVGVASDHDSSRAALTGLPAEPPPQRRQHVLGVTVAIEAGEDYRVLQISRPSRSRTSYKHPSWPSDRDQDLRRAGAVACARSPADLDEARRGGAQDTGSGWKVPGADTSRDRANPDDRHPDHPGSCRQQAPLMSPTRMIRNIHGTISEKTLGSGQPDAGQPQDSQDRSGGLRSRERARYRFRRSIRSPPPASN